MNKKLFITTGEMMECLGVSKAHAYKIIKKLNEQLKNDGYMTVTGRVSRKYFAEKFYRVIE